jgi:hypothetical protein
VQATNPGELAQLGLEGRQHVDRAGAGGGPAGLQVDVVAEVAEVGRLAVDRRHLARDVDQVAGPDAGDVGGDRDGRRGQADAELLEALLGRRLLRGRLLGG